MTASIDDDELRVSAGRGDEEGHRGDARLRITDGTTEPVEGTVTVRVIASTRELPTANDDVIDEAAPGQDDLGARADNDVNPFPDKPLKVTTAVLETGQGDVDVAGDQVQVTPDAKFFGTMVVRYRVQDATGDPDREVEGRIRLTVQGKPDAPGTPTVSSVQDRTVVLSWTPPANNGAEIERYLVSSTAGNYEKECARHHLHARRPDQQRRVQLHGRRREPRRRRPTRRRRPRPRAPTRVPIRRPHPSLVFGDRSLSVSWVTPTTPGSPVEKYNLEISPAPPSGISQKTDVTGNSMVWDGLQNGVAYQVRVQALNRAPEPSSWSAWSASEIPARAPDAPAAPTTARLQPVGSPGADAGGVERTRRQRRCDLAGTSSTSFAASSLRQLDPRRRGADESGRRRGHLDHRLHVPACGRRTRPAGVSSARPRRRSARSRRPVLRRTWQRARAIARSR